MVVDVMKPCKKRNHLNRIANQVSQRAGLGFMNLATEIIANKTCKDFLS
jgi:hypothetical protein